MRQSQFKRTDSRSQRQGGNRNPAIGKHSQYLLQPLPLATQKVIARYEHIIKLQAGQIRGDPDLLVQLFLYDSFCMQIHQKHGYPIISGCLRIRYCRNHGQIADKSVGDISFCAVEPPAAFHFLGAHFNTGRITAGLTLGIAKTHQRFAFDCGFAIAFFEVIRTKEQQAHQP